MASGDVIIFEEQVTREDIESRRSKLPSDIHLVEYVKGNELFLDAVRCYRMVDIFDFYYDILNEEAKTEGSTFEIRSITSGYGSIKPKLYNSAKTK